jgi:Protein of unknown function (DUF2975)
MTTKNLLKTKTEHILSVMSILAWVAFIGFMIEAGVILFSYGVSLVNPEAATNLYRGLNLFNLRQFNFWHYTLSVSFLVALSMMKSWASFLVIGALSKFNLKNPFTMEVAMRLEKISVITFGTWVVTMLCNAHTGWLLKKTSELHGNWLSGEFIFMIGIVFILSQVFKRGVEIQSENELTV